MGFVLLEEDARQLCSTTRKMLLTELANPGILVLDFPVTVTVRRESLWLVPLFEL